MTEDKVTNIKTSLCKWCSKPMYSINRKKVARCCSHHCYQQYNYYVLGYGEKQKKITIDKKENKFCKYCYKKLTGNMSIVCDNNECRKRNCNETAVLRRKNNIEKHLLVEKNYRLTHKKHIAACNKRYSTKHIGQIREKTMLYSLFNTCTLPIEIKQIYAFVHLGKRLSNISHSKPIIKDKAIHALHLIKKGVTHVAYE